jgi:hypothetical protein
MTLGTRPSPRISSNNCRGEGGQQHAGQRLMQGGLGAWVRRGAVCRFTEESRAGAFAEGGKQGRLE